VGASLLIFLRVFVGDRISAKNLKKVLSARFSVRKAGTEGWCAGATER